MNRLFNWVLNFAPVIGVVIGWVRKYFNVRVVGFLLAKGIVFFICYKYFPLLLGRWYQWIYDIGVSTKASANIDLSALLGIEIPAITGVAAWLVRHLKLDICFNIVVSSAVASFALKSLPFFR